MYSCGSDVPKMEIDAQNIPVLSVDSLTLKYSEDGDLSYRFTTQKMERFDHKDSVFMVFPEGVFVETFNDSTMLVESFLEADYGYFNETDELWEIKGNVVAQSKDGKKLYTEHLYWNQSKKKIYSFVESIIVDGEERMVGQNGFDADEDMNNVIFKNSIGRILIDTTKNTSSVVDTTTQITSKEQKIEEENNYKN